MTAEGPGSASDTLAGLPPLRVAALVKQVPVVEAMQLRPDSRLERQGVPLEMSAYCRRAVAKGVELAQATAGTCTVVTMGPPSAEDVLREAIAFGADAGVLITDPSFAGSDTLATARALAAAITLIEREQGAPFDLILVGRNSVDADTGQVGPEVAQLLDLAFATGVKHLTLRRFATDPEVEAADGGPPRSDLVADVGLEHDDVWVEASVRLPAILGTAERLIDPCKIKDREVWATIDTTRMRVVTAADLGPGPWGQAGSPTSVGATRIEAVDRAALRLDGSIADQVAQAVDWLADRGVFHTAPRYDEAIEIVPVHTVGEAVPVVVVIVEPDREGLTRELLTGAVRLAVEIGGRVVAVGPTAAILPVEGAAGGPAELGSWGADEVLAIDGSTIEEDVATAIIEWAGATPPWAILAGGTAWGREVASRIAASLGAGLTGDAVGFAVTDDRLVAWKPAFGGSLVAAITSASAVQIATIRAGVLATFRPRAGSSPPLRHLSVAPRGRVVVHERRREDNVDDLLKADMVIGVGQGVDPAHYGELEELRSLLQAQFGATRKVTDNGWLPHSRQIGITGHSLSPRVYLAIGTSGKFNHMVGVRSAGTVMAINPDPEALVFGVSDIGIVGDWREVVPVLTRRLRDAIAATNERP